MTSCSDAKATMKAVRIHTVLPLSEACRAQELIQDIRVGKSRSMPSNVKELRQVLGQCRRGTLIAQSAFYDFDGTETVS